MGMLQLHGIEHEESIGWCFSVGKVWPDTLQAAPVDLDDDPDSRAISVGCASHADYQLDWPYSSKSMDNGICNCIADPINDVGVSNML